MTSKSSKLTDLIEAKLEQQHVPMFKIPGFRHYKPQPVKPIPGPDLLVKKIFENIQPMIPADLDREIGGYVHTSHDPDLDAQVRGYTCLTEKPLLEQDFEMFYVAFVGMALDCPDVFVNETPSFTLEAVMDQMVSSNSAGLLPLNTMFGEAEGNKKEMQTGAAMVNLTDAKLDAPGCLPAKPCAKMEVKKKNKKTRVIMVESEANYQINRLVFEDVVSIGRNFATGSAIGMSTSDGDFKMILMSWYKEHLNFHPDTDWNEFLEWLSSVDIDESDKKSWESSTNMVDGLTYICQLLGSVPLIKCKSLKTLLARSLADYINPCVLIKKDKAYFAPWRVMSGSYMTAHGNTERHGIMVRTLCDIIQLHGGVLNDNNCDCWACSLLRVSGVGTDSYSDEQLAYLRRNWRLGDDFIAINSKPSFSKALDLMFGTTTETKFKKFFSTPGLHEPEGAEFLKKHFYLDKTFHTWNVYTFRAPGRLLAKLKYGSATVNADRFKAALLSAVWECGANKPLYDILRCMWDQIAVTDVDVFDQEIQKYAKKNYMLTDNPYVYCPEYNVLLNNNGSLLRPLEKVWWSDALKKQTGLPLYMY